MADVVFKPYLDLQNAQNHGPCTAYTLYPGILGHDILGTFGGPGNSMKSVWAYTLDFGMLRRCIGHFGRSRYIIPSSLYGPSGSLASKAYARLLGRSRLS